MHQILKTYSSHIHFEKIIGKNITQGKNFEFNRLLSKLTAETNAAIKDKSEKNVNKKITKIILQAFSIRSGEIDSSALDIIFKLKYLKQKSASEVLNINQNAFGVFYIDELIDKLVPSRIIMLKVIVQGALSERVLSISLICSM